jgi:hypothetical protein
MNPPRRTNGETSSQPFAWTPDSKAVLFASDRNGTWGIFKQGISQETSEAVVTGGQSVNIDDFLRLSTDGAWMLVVEIPRAPVNPSPPQRLMRIPVNGGVPQLVMEMRGWRDLWCARAPATSASSTRRVRIENSS